MSIEAMKLAMEALESGNWYINQLELIVYSDEDTGIHEEVAKMQSAITALQQAIAEAEQSTEQEPFRFTNQENWLSGNGRMWSEIHKEDGDFPVFIDPPQRKPLTDEEIDAIWRNETKPERNTYEMVRAFARAVEAKLKEKNT